MLTLNIPDKDAALQHAVETRPKAVADWLGRLPFSSPADTAQQLLIALYALNRHPLGEDDRSALLALYRPVIARAANSLESQLAEAGVPPHAQQRQIGSLLRELHIEHSIGYKQALLALANRRFGRASAKRTAEVTARLLVALYDVQTACDLTHTPPPAGLWQEMRRIYEFAMASNLADLAVGDAPAPGKAYIQSLLFALADPPHMTHAELIHTRLYLGQFVGLGALTAVPVDGHRGFPISAEGDAAPNPHAATAPGDRWLDTDALCSHLHEIAVRLRTGETPRRIGLPAGMESELSLSLCKRLMKQWSGGMQRGFRRHATPGSTVHAVTGLSAIHRLLDPEQQTPWPDPEDADSLLISDTQRLTAAAPAPATVSRWTVDNDSAAGLALSGKPDAPLNLKVGDPLALQADGAAAWSLGVIRWIRMRDAQQVELGIERLSPQVRPVWVRPLRGHRMACPEAALFVPGLAALQQKDRLLLPRYLYQIGMDADVWHPPHQYTLTFGRRLEHTPSFDLIDFTVFADEAS
ncbi:hypothetical protein [Thiobacillus sp.]